MRTIVVLGGYGNFGKRIAENLARIPDVSLVIAGRSVEKARLLAEEIQTSISSVVPLQIDIDKDDFEQKLKKLSPFVVIHTCGPFQNQDHRVPIACINIGAHYIDLADDRRFVCDIISLDKRATENGLTLVSGASSVPGLSSVVIDHYRNQFVEIRSIDIAIAPGNKAERGEATVRGILSYTGHGFEVYSAGKWQTAFGWMDPGRFNFGGSVGWRWLANVDAPDLELFPARYSVTGTVRFQAGLELTLLHLAMVTMAYVAKLGIVRDWSRITKPIMKISQLFSYFGTDKGGMNITISGQDRDGESKRLIWSLYADDAIGPYIPTITAIILSKKLLAGELKGKGALPCLGLYTLEEFAPYAEELGIRYGEVSDG